jgi:uncharacterized membrane protein
MLNHQVFSKHNNPTFVETSTLAKEPTQAMSISYSETTKRSLVKTITWRMIGTMDTILIAWLITGTLGFAVSIGATELITKMVLYFLHERTWNYIPYGK